MPPDLFEEGRQTPSFQGVTRRDPDLGGDHPRARRDSGTSMQEPEPRGLRSSPLGFPADRSRPGLARRYSDACHDIRHLGVEILNLTQAPRGRTVRPRRPWPQGSGWTLLPLRSRILPSPASPDHHPVCAGQAACHKPAPISPVGLYRPQYPTELTGLMRSSPSDSSDSVGRPAWRLLVTGLVRRATQPGLCPQRA